MTPHSFETVFSDLVRIVADALRVDPTTITPDTNLIVDLNAESIDLVDIRFRIEETYGFQVEQRAFIAAIAADVPGGDVLEMLTMRRLTNFVLRRKSEVA